CWREASANRSNFRALRGVIMAKDGARVLDQQGTGWVLRGSLKTERNSDFYIDGVAMDQQVARNGAGEGNKISEPYYLNQINNLAQTLPIF
ncbi:hypothetical protein, partial [Acidovorax sp. SUPP2825]|uniref:hypothetical protein n=1 Tax=Acidovorax sp. SUPP2825 TaxID=2920879 RepID=UPI0024E0B58C